MMETKLIPMLTKLRAKSILPNDITVMIATRFQGEPGEVNPFDLPFDLSGFPGSSQNFPIFAQN